MSWPVYKETVLLIFQNRSCRRNLPRIEITWIKFGITQEHKMVNAHVLYLQTIYNSKAIEMSVFRVIPVRIQTECGKIRTRITPNMDTFHAVIFSIWYLWNLTHFVNLILTWSWDAETIILKIHLYLMNWDNGTNWALRFVIHLFPII